MILTRLPFLSSLLRYLRPATPMEKAIGYRFYNRQWLQGALTHASSTRGRSNDCERLAFLGDAVLGMVAGNHLFNTAHELGRGELTTQRSRLVRASTLSDVAQRWQLLDHVNFSRGINKSSVSSHSQADLLESIIGAVYCDGGMNAVTRLINREIIAFIPLDEDDSFDCKSRLQQECQHHWQQVPEYRLLDASGPDHERIFTAEALIMSKVVGTGVGSTIKSAENEAAREGLVTLENKHAEIDSAQETLNSKDNNDN